jgi:hypothetical protein
LCDKHLALNVYTVCVIIGRPGGHSSHYHLSLVRCLSNCYYITYECSAECWLFNDSHIIYVDWVFEEWWSFKVTKFGRLILTRPPRKTCSIAYVPAHDVLSLGQYDDVYCWRALYVYPMWSHLDHVACYDKVYAYIEVWHHTRPAFFSAVAGDFQLDFGMMGNATSAALQCRYKQSYCTFAWWYRLDYCHVRTSSHTHRIHVISAYGEILIWECYYTIQYPFPVIYFKYDSSCSQSYITNEQSSTTEIHGWSGGIFTADLYQLYPMPDLICWHNVMHAHLDILDNVTSTFFSPVFVINSKCKTKALLAYVSWDIIHWSQT